MPSNSVQGGRNVSRRTQNRFFNSFSFYIHRPKKWGLEKNEDKTDLKEDLPKLSLTRKAVNFPDQSRGPTLI